VHFWFDRQVMKKPFVTLLDTRTQWIFQQNRIDEDINGRANKTDGGQVPAISGQRVIRIVAEIAPGNYDLCLSGVRTRATAREAQLVKATVIKEAAATFSPEPGGSLAPKQKHPARIVSCGRTGPPRAGRPRWKAQCAAGILSGSSARVAGAPRKFLQPDLEPDGFVAMWLGKSQRRRTSRRELIRVNETGSSSWSHRFVAPTRRSLQEAFARSVDRWYSAL